MLFDVGPLLRQPMGASREYELHEHLEPLEDAPGGEVDGRVSFLRTNHGLLVTANLSLTSEGRCSRCLEPLQESYNVDFKEEFSPKVDAVTGSRLEPLSEDAFEIDERQTLDLSEAIRQYELTSQSMQPLCRPDCRGLCPDCGGNLNLGFCSCQPEEGDPRLADLSKIRLTVDNQEGSN